VALETGAHSAWVSALITECGHESVVANARDLAAVTDRSNRDDRRDARQLARLARVDPELLHPVRLRDSAKRRPSTEAVESMDHYEELLPTASSASLPANRFGRKSSPK
jgi:hypothetical protein